MSTGLNGLEKTFRENFPAWAKGFDNVKDDSEFFKLQQEYLTEANSKLAKALGKTVEQLDSADQTAPIALSPDLYNSLISASGDDIEKQLHVLLDTISRLKGMDDTDDVTLAATLAAGGIGALGSAAAVAYKTSIISGAVEDMAILAGVEAATVGVICAVAVVAIVAVIIPILYFMRKPALCLIFLINETEKKLILKEEYNVHGKPVMNTTPINSAFLLGTSKQRTYGGFIATSKRDNALFGTQYGITYTVGENGPEVSFGTDCPLTSLEVDNNCFCEVNGSAKSAAEKTDSNNVQTYMARGNGLKLTIDCNSKDGDVAYYIARVRPS